MSGKREKQLRREAKERGEKSKRELREYERESLRRAMAGIRFDRSRGAQALQRVSAIAAVLALPPPGGGR